ncbi:MAG: SAM-dependent methyltransferase [Terracidiphilus sp.]
MAIATNQNDRESGLPSRTSILVAAARAFGSRDPDEDVRNPDLLADRLIGPDELALISGHPCVLGLMQDYAEAMLNPAVVFFAGMMIVRTRFIDEALVRAVKNGASQVVILGAGFDSRAYRFRELLRDCPVFEADAESTQEYKKRRVKDVLGDAPANLTYVKVDFAKDNICDVLKAAGFREGAKSFYIWEGVCMYLPEESVRKTLRMVASHSAPGSSMVLDYASSIAIEFGKLTPHGAGGIPADWSEPWIFGVPGANGSEFFHELGFDPGIPISFNNPEAIKRYALRRDGASYASRAIDKLRAEAQARIQEGIAPPPLPEGFLKAQKAIREAGGVYWLAELTVL